jgi:hypothetical protein
MTTWLKVTGDVKFPWTSNDSWTSDAIEGEDTEEGCLSEGKEQKQMPVPEKVHDVGQLSGKNEQQIFSIILFGYR